MAAMGKPSWRTFPDHMKRTPLDDYVEAPDAAYTWSLNGTGSGDGYTYYQIFMTSQNYLTTAEVDRPQWDHWITITVPDDLRYNDTAFVWVDGGSNPGGPRTPWEPIAQAAVEMGTVGMELYQIPNQPLCFVNDDPPGRCRTEDSLISFSWEQFLRGGDNKNPLWCSRLPMVKAQVRAHDTLTAFAQQHLGLDIERFITAGGSKRGWTVWLTAAVDLRVVGVAPLVIDIANMQAVMNHHFQAYGRWAVAVMDYEPLMGWLNTPDFDDLLAIEDPTAYFDRFDRLPAINIYATGDEFFLPDGSKFYWDLYPEPKTLRYVPNCEHSMIGHIQDVLGSVMAFAHVILEGSEDGDGANGSTTNNVVMPRISWTVDPADQGLTVTIEAGDVEEVLLWSSHRPVRNFVITLNWRNQTLLPQPDGTYYGVVPEPADGFAGFFVEVRFKSDSGDTRFNHFKATTGVSISPDRYDHAPCGDACTCGPPENCAAMGLAIPKDQLFMPLPPRPVVNDDDAPY